MAENRSIFQFKQFQLSHGAPGLKIGTEACIFGAFLAKWAFGNMLEIGTGCGVLTAMVAQSHPTNSIDTLEIEPSVAQLAQSNFEKLPFTHLINLYTINCKSFFPNKSYDFLFSNPPFFVNHLPNTSQSKQIAMHSENLSPQELSEILIQLSHDKSEIALIYPPHIMDEISKLLGVHGFQPNEKIQVIPNEGGKVLRTIALFSKQQKSNRFFDLIVKNSDQNYSPEFQELLQPYYLIFP